MTSSRGGASGSIGAYASYWVYQHLGNLSPDQLAADEVYERVLGHHRRRRAHPLPRRCRLASRRGRRRRCAGASPATSAAGPAGAPRRHRLDGARATSTPTTGAWSTPSSGTGCAEPCSTPDGRTTTSCSPRRCRSSCCRASTTWRDGTRRSRRGRWGRPGKWVGERMRQALDLEHWASFRESFGELVDLLRRRRAVAGRRRRRSCMLSATCTAATPRRPTLDGATHPGTAIHQLTMSPFRNDIQRAAKAAYRLLNRDGPSTPSCTASPARRGVDDVGMHWQLDHGLWFDNGVMSIEFRGRQREPSSSTPICVTGIARSSSVRSSWSCRRRADPRSDGRDGGLVREQCVRTVYYAPPCVPPVSSLGLPAALPSPRSRMAAHWCRHRILVTAELSP